MASQLLALAREAVAVALLASAPPLAAAAVVGLAAGALQALTQLHDPSAPVVLRLAAVMGVLGVAGPWMAARLVRFAAVCLEAAARGAP